MIIETTLTLKQAVDKLKVLLQQDYVVATHIPTCFRQDFEEWMIGRTRSIHNERDSITAATFKQYYDKIMFENGVFYNIKFAPHGLWIPEFVKVNYK